MEPVLGSRSTDILSGLGPEKLAPGTVLPIGPEPDAVPADRRRTGGDPAGRRRSCCGPSSAPAPSSFADPQRARPAPPGPPPAAATGWACGWKAAPWSAPATGELPSEGIVRGAIQVPPGGEPVLFLADHPVTGGYPVAAVVLDADVDRAAQVRPGQRVRFVLVPPPS